MPRFHFNVYDGRHLLDEEGFDLPDRATARREAIRLAGAIIAEEVWKQGGDVHWRLEVVDEHAEVLVRLDFRVGEVASSGDEDPS